MATPTKQRGKWRIRWIDHAGNRRSEVYADRKQAVLALKGHELDAGTIRAGLKDAPPPEKAVGDAVDYWEQHRAPHKRSASKDESIIRCHIRPSLGHLPLGDLTVEHLDRFKGALLGKLSAKTAHNILTLTLSMLRVAVDLGWLVKVPPLRKPKLFEQDYQFLTDEERDRFLHAALEEGVSVHAFYCTALFTGLRFGELCGLQWKDINFDRRQITVGRSYDKPTKSGKVRRVPIFDPLLPVLREHKLRTPGPLVFPTSEGTMRQPSDRISQEVFIRVLDCAGFPRRETKGGGSRGYIRFHDLRHSFASSWAASGGDMFRLQRMLGHASITVTMRYSHLAPDAFAADLGRLGQAAPTTLPTVLPFPSR